MLVCASATSVGTGTRLSHDLQVKGSVSLDSEVRHDHVQGGQEVAVKPRE